MLPKIHVSPPSRVVLIAGFFFASDEMQILRMTHSLSESQPTDAAKNLKLAAANGLAVALTSSVIPLLQRFLSRIVAWGAAIPHVRTAGMAVLGVGCGCAAL